MHLIPNVSSGYFPLKLRHGWKPNTPLKLQYSVWVQDNLGGMNLEEWVLENAERVQALREKTKVKYKEVSKLRKEA